MDLARFLRPTPYLDLGHPRVAALAAEVSEAEEEPGARAARLFRRVRDEIRYDPYRIRLEPDALTAGATLAAGHGFCVTKAVVYAAGLRALGIPARLGFADVVNHLSTARLRREMRTDLFVFHGFTEAWLEGRWVKATPAFDAPLCARFGVDPLEFDGVHDAVLQPANRGGDRFLEYVRDRGSRDDLPFDELVAAWREAYPHLFTGQRRWWTGEFETES